MISKERHVRTGSILQTFNNTTKQLFLDFSRKVQQNRYFITILNENFHYYSNRDCNLQG